MQVTPVEVSVEGHSMKINITHDGADDIQLAATAYNALRDAEFVVGGQTFSSVEVEDWLA